MSTLVLGIDCSSVWYGWVVWDRLTECVVDHGVTRLGDSKKSLGLRALAAYEMTRTLLHLGPFERIGIEAPAFASREVVAQQRVISGIGMALAANDLPEALEIAPSSVKKALTNNGRADKELMLTTARNFFTRPITEHEADALGVVFGALKK